MLARVAHPEFTGRDHPPGARLILLARDNSKRLKPGRGKIEQTARLILLVRLIILSGPTDRLTKTHELHLGGRRARGGAALDAPEHA